MAVIILHAMNSSEAGYYFFEIMSNFIVERTVSFWLVAAEACVQSWPSLCDLWRKMWDLCRHFSNYFGFPPVGIIPQKLHTHFHLHADLARTTYGQSLGHFKKHCSFRNQGALNRKSL